MRGGIKSIYTPIYDVNLYELLKTYANLNAQKSFQNKYSKITCFNKNRQ